MAITIKLPAPDTNSALALGARITEAIRQDAPGADSYTVALVLRELYAMHTGPRYAAWALPNGAGWVVVDRRTGDVEQRYEGYFAGQDARTYAAEANEREARRTPARVED